MSDGTLLNPVFWEKVQGQKHPGRWEIAERQTPSVKMLFKTNTNDRKLDVLCQTGKVLHALWDRKISLSKGYYVTITLPPLSSLGNHQLEIFILYRFYFQNSLLLSQKVPYATMLILPHQAWGLPILSVGIFTFKISNTRRTLVGACRRCSNYIFIPDLTSGFGEFGKDSRKTVWESFKRLDLVRLILET